MNLIKYDIYLVLFIQHNIELTESVWESKCYLMLNNAQYQEINSENKEI